MALPKVVNSWIWYTEQNTVSTISGVNKLRTLDTIKEFSLTYQLRLIYIAVVFSDSRLLSFFFFLLLIERPWRGTQAANSLINMMPDVLIDCPYDGECWEVFE